MNSSAGKHSIVIFTRVKGFTLLELLVGMIVSGLVIGATFSAYHMIARQGTAYTEYSAADLERSLLHSVITRDQVMADSFSCDEQERCTWYYYDQGAVLRTIDYEFHEQYALRIAREHTDTFHLNPEEFRERIETGDKLNRKGP